MTSVSLKVVERDYLSHKSSFSVFLFFYLMRRVIDLSEEEKSSRASQLLIEVDKKQEKLHADQLQREWKAQHRQRICEYAMLALSVSSLRFDKTLNTPPHPSCALHTSIELVKPFRPPGGT